VLYRHIPAELVDRPKRGFAFPLCEWLPGALRDWAEDLLDSSKMATAGYLNPGLVRSMWTEHLSGAREWSYRLWSVLMFESWRRQLLVCHSSQVEFNHV